MHGNRDVCARDKIAELLKKGLKTSEISKITGKSEWLVSDVKHELGLVHYRLSSEGENKHKQLCWTCSKACGSCSWSDGTFTPVQGWMATEVSRQGISKKTYAISACPLYEKEDYRPNCMSTYELIRI